MNGSHVVAGLVVLLLLGSVGWSASLTDPHEHREFLAVTEESTESFKLALDHGELDRVEPTPIEDLPPTARQLITDTRDQPTDEISDHGDDWHTSSVGICRDSMLVCDDVSEWPAVFDRDRADGEYEPHTKMTYHYYVVADGDERLIVLTSDGHTFIDRDFVALVVKAVTFGPLAVVIGGVSYVYGRRRPRSVYWLAGLGALFVLWGVSYPYVELSTRIDVPYHRGWFAAASWLSITLVGGWFSYRYLSTVPEPDGATNSQD